MAYCKYSHFLMPKDGPEYEATYKASTELHISASVTAKLVAAASLLIAHSCCRHKSSTLTRQRKVLSGDRLAVKSHHG